MIISQVSYRTIGPLVLVKRSLQLDKKEESYSSRCSVITAWLTSLILCLLSIITQNNYTPGIYADGYIAFAFPFVTSYVR